MNIWILNHYAGDMFFSEGGRHYCFGKYLKQMGYNPTIFCANSKHNANNEEYLDLHGLWSEKNNKKTDVPYVFVKTKLYSGNGKDRILNMVDFYRNVKRTAKQYYLEKGKPDVILASSVHPLTLVAGIQLAKYFNVKCICEVRDLWPESIVAYSSRWKRTNPIIKLLYAGEKWIYKKADYIIMTWAGGYDYIKDRGWQSVIPESKVFHISNGVDLDSYKSNIHKYPFSDTDLSNNCFKSFIYTGSIRKVNNLGVLVSAAEELKLLGRHEAKIIVFGNGDELDALKKETEERHLDNICFKGRVSKQSIPSILAQGYATILHNTSTELNKYGQSQNKFFEYLAAGRPILMTYSVGHSVIKEHGCGVELMEQTPKAIANAIKVFCDLSEDEYRQYCNNAEVCSRQFDYKELSKQLIHIIDLCI